MKIEERLHDAMHEYADTIEPEPGSWTRISARFDNPLPPAPRPSRRPLVLAGVALALIVVLITTLVVRDDEETTRVAIGPPSMPSRILSISQNGHPVVLDSTTGEQQMGLESSIAEGTQIAVTPDGQDAYMVTGEGNEGCADHSILRLPVGPRGRGGDEVATGATSPTVSPDGQYLAYLHCRPGQVRAHEIVLRDFTTGEERVTSSPANAAFVQHLEFASDSRRVFVGLQDDPAPEAPSRRSPPFGPPALVREIDIVGGEPAPGRDLGVVAGGHGWVAVRGETGEHLGVKGTPPSVLGMQRQGEAWTAGPLFTVPNTPTQVVSDRTGRHILVVADGALYRWSVGDKEATKLPGKHIGAAWIPDAPAPAPAPTPTTAPAPGAVGMPEDVVAAINGRLSVLRAQGGERSSLAVPEGVGGDAGTGAVTGLSSVSSRLDAAVGAYSVFFTSTGRNSACSDGSGPDVSMLTAITDPVRGPEKFRTLEARRFVGGAQTPVVSPDGKFVAYGLECGMYRLGMTRLGKKRYERFRIDPLGDSSRVEAEDTVEVLGWSPDSKQMLYRVWIRDDASPRYVVGKIPPVVAQSELEVHDLEVAPDVVAATFIDNGTLALATSTDRDGASVVKGFPLRSVRDASKPGSVLITPTLFEVPGLVTSLVADPSGNHFLARNDDGVLYRWSVGDPAPTKLADDVTAAGWFDGGVAPESSVRFGADAALPRDFPSAVPLPDAGPLRSVVSEKDPPNASYTMTYGLEGQDALAVGNRYRERLERAGFKIAKLNGVEGSDSSAISFDAIGKKWDVAVVSGTMDPRDRTTLSVQVRTHGYAASGIGGIGDTGQGVTVPTG